MCTNSRDFDLDTEGPQNSLFSFTVGNLALRSVVRSVIRSMWIVFRSFHNCLHWLTVMSSYFLDRMNLLFCIVFSESVKFVDLDRSWFHPWTPTALCYTAYALPTESRGRTEECSPTLYQIWYPLLELSLLRVIVTANLSTRFLFNILPLKSPLCYTLLEM